MRRCHGCGKFVSDNKVCTVCGKPPADVYGLGYQMTRWDELQRRLWQLVVEMGIRTSDEYDNTVWEA
jgi:uncharacterized membrane protein YvbJ